MPICTSVNLKPGEPQPQAGRDRLQSSSRPGNAGRRTVDGLVDVANQEHIALLKQGAEVVNLQRPQHPEMTLDLAVEDLDGLDLRNMDLSGAYFGHANLGNTKLVNAKLVGADFSNASLDEADLTGADLSDAAMAGWSRCFTWRRS